MITFRMQVCTVVCLVISWGVAKVGFAQMDGLPAVAVAGQGALVSSEQIFDIQKFPFGICHLHGLECPHRSGPPFGI